LKDVSTLHLQDVVVKKLPDLKDPKKTEEITTSLHGFQLLQLKVEQIHSYAH